MSHGMEAKTASSKGEPGGHVVGRDRLKGSDRRAQASFYRHLLLLYGALPESFSHTAGLPSLRGAVCDQCIRATYIGQH